MDMSRDPLALVPDEALVVLYANGDREAARALTSRLLPRILGYVARILQDRAEAEDVAQEAMLRLWRVAPNWRPDEAKVTTWLYRVVVNLCTDRLRARQRRKLDALDDVAEPADSATSVVTAMIDVERQLALETALATLPDRQRQAVVLRHIEGLTNPEIADIMAIGVEAVESLTARGKRTLTQILSGQKAALGYEGVE
jgi:RNA polymerase sigma factor (sigma-70 family)